MQRGVTAVNNVVYLTEEEKEEAEKECRIVDTTGALRLWLPPHKTPTADSI